MPNNPEWQPSQIRILLKEAINSSTSPFVVLTDCGEGHLKALGNPEGPHSLAREWIGTRLADYLGLPTFDYAIVNVSELFEAYFYNGEKIQEGPAFISRTESGSSWVGGESILQKAINTSDISRLILFDTWIRNRDRFFQDNSDPPRRNFGNVFFSREAPPGKFLLKAIDHTHILTSQSELHIRDLGISDARDCRIYGLFPEFRSYLNKEVVKEFSQKLANIERKYIQLIMREIPPQWEVSTELREHVCSFLLNRAAFLSNDDYIFNRLFPQKEFNFDDPEDLS
mgnify:CR=1 FL=1